VLALELALKLEEEGRDGNLFIVDSSPDFMKMLVEQNAGNSEDQFEISIIRTMFSLLAPHEATSAAVSKVFNDRNVKPY
jgi:hypothetical protein